MPFTPLVAHQRTAWLWAAALTTVDLVVLYLIMRAVLERGYEEARGGGFFPVEDASGWFVWRVLALAFANGVALSLWKRSRLIGGAVLMGVGVAGLLLLLEGLLLVIAIGS